MSYVTSKYIGTSGCSTSPELYAKWLNRSKGLSQCCLDTKLLDNFAKVAVTRISGESGSNSHSRGEPPRALRGSNLVKLTRRPIVPMLRIGSRRRASLIPPGPKGPGFLGDY